MTLRQTVYTVLGLVLVGVIVAIGTTSYSSVCDQCGLKRDSLSMFDVARDRQFAKLRYLVRK